MHNKSGQLTIFIIIAIVIIGFAVLFFAFQQGVIQEPLIYYKLNLDYSYGNILINSTEIEFSNEIIENLFGFYSANILDNEGNLLNLTLFDVPNEILYDTINEEGEISGGGFLELNETQFDIFVPYYENAKEIVIYNENLSELTRKDVSEFSKAREEITEELPEEETEKKIEEKPIETLTNNLSQYWWVLIIILAVLIGYLFYFLTKKK